MRHERRNAHEHLAFGRLQERAQIVETLGRSERQRIDASLTQRFDETSGARRRRCATITVDIVDASAALAQCVAKMAAAAFAAKDGDALAAYVVQRRQREQALA